MMPCDGFYGIVLNDYGNVVYVIDYGICRECVGYMNMLEAKSNSLVDVVTDYIGMMMNRLMDSS